MAKETEKVEKDLQVREVIKRHLLAMIQEDQDVREGLVTLCRGEGVEPDATLIQTITQRIQEQLLLKDLKDLVRWTDLRPEAFTGAAAARFMAGR